MATIIHMHPQQDIRMLASELDAFLPDAEDRRSLSANIISIYLGERSRID